MPFYFAGVAAITVMQKKYKPLSPNAMTSFTEGEVFKASLCAIQPRGLFQCKQQMVVPIAAELE